MPVVLWIGLLVWSRPLEHDADAMLDSGDDNHSLARGGPKTCARAQIVYIAIPGRIAKVSPGNRVHIGRIRVIGVLHVVDDLLRIPSVRIGAAEGPGDLG